MNKSNRTMPQTFAMIYHELITGSTLLCVKATVPFHWSAKSKLFKATTISKKLRKQQLDFKEHTDHNGASCRNHTLRSSRNLSASWLDGTCPHRLK